MVSCIKHGPVNHNSWMNGRWESMTGQPGIRKSIRKLSVYEMLGMRKTRRMQLVEIEGQKTCRKLTSQLLIRTKLVEKLQITNRL